MSEEQFWHSNPRIWAVWEEAHKQVVKEQNYINFVNGLYTLRGLQVALDHGFNKNAKSEYFDKPIQIFALSEKEIKAKQKAELEKIISFFDDMGK